jgi:hypothetical protein
MKTDCDHYWEFQITQWQYPSGVWGTAQAVEYAYLLCRKCGATKKVRVQEDKSTPTKKA